MSGTRQERPKTFFRIFLYCLIDRSFRSRGLSSSLNTHLLLESPQRKQRGFLGWSESLCSGNIESFVGSVALQGTYQLGALQVPHLDGTILTATGQQRAGTYPA